MVIVIRLIIPPADVCDPKVARSTCRTLRVRQTECQTTLAEGAWWMFHSHQNECIGVCR